MTVPDTKVKVAIVLPAFNEETAIGLTLEDFSKYLPNARYYLVDNNCTDHTVKIATLKAKELDLNLSVIKESIQGKGNAVRKAFAQIEADIFILVDADFTYPAEDAPKMIKKLFSDGLSMVIGDRITAGSYSSQNTRQLHNFGNKVVTKTINLLFRTNLKDVLSGYRIMDRDFVKNLPILGEGFELETEITIHALDKRFSIYEFPVNYRSRPNGSVSKLHTLRDGAKVLRMIFRIFKDYKPLRFFLLASSVPSLLGFACGVIPIMDYVETRFVSHVPLAVLSAALEICALLLLCIGIVLQNLANTERRLFEIIRLRT
jgi:glycosyltransferase involved in cell wall biosynthesis